MSGAQAVAAIAKATGGSAGNANEFGGGSGGNAAAGATAYTTSSKSAYASAFAQGGGAGAGGDGGNVTGATATAQSRGLAVAIASGAGGGGVGSNYGGGSGGDVSGVAASASGYSARVVALGFGGSGGGGEFGGSAGGSVSLIDAVSGATTGGYLYGKQGAYGGPGQGGEFASGSAGEGGSATSKLALSDAQASLITGVSVAQGGPSDDFVDWLALDGAATASATVSGAQKVVAIAKATGGAADLHGGRQGGAATAGATASTTSAADSAYVLVVAQGGGDNVGGVAQVTPSSASGYNAYVKASQIGGASAAYGGAGAASTIVNKVSGQTTGGMLSLYQRAVGGAGTSPIYLQGGAGGAADSELTFDDTANPIHASQVAGTVIATGGAGGYFKDRGYSGGQANASLVLTGAAAVTAATTATGGAAGVAAAIPGGAGGTAKALTTAYGAAVTASATAHGGAGQIAGHASAKTKAVGTSGTLSASADTARLPGQLIQAASALAAGPVDGDMSAKAKVVIGAAVVEPFEASGQAVALESAAPDGAGTSAVLNANPNIAAAFGASPSFFAIDELGGSSAKSGGTTSETTTESVDLTVDLTQLASRQDLVVGFYNATGLGTGFSSLTFTLTGDGAQLFTETFTTLSSAEIFFTDNAMDLGSLATGPLSGNTLTLQASFSLTTTSAGQGFYAQMIIGDPPPGPSTRPFAQAMGGLAGAPAGSRCRRPARSRRGPCRCLLAGRSRPAPRRRDACSLVRRSALETRRLYPLFFRKAPNGYGR